MKKIKEADSKARLRVIHLYHDALSVIANYPINEPYLNGNELSEWMKAKAQEALAKTDDAIEGRIYAQIK